MKKLFTAILALSSVSLFGAWDAHTLNVYPPTTYNEISVSAAATDIAAGDWTWNFGTDRFEASLDTTTVTYYKLGSTNQKITAALTSALPTGLTISADHTFSGGGTFSLTDTATAIYSAISTDGEGSGTVTLNFEAAQSFVDAATTFSSAVTYTIADDV